MKKLYSCFVTLLALLGLPGAVQAQATFRPGYIVSLKGDTVRGSAAYGRGKRSAAECQFKADNASAIATYLPDQLQGYGFPHNRFYESRRALAANPASDTSSKRMFLEVLVQGPASLYYAADDTGDHYYIRSGNGLAQPLVQLSEMVTVNGNRVKRENPLFRATLTTAFQACPAVGSKVSTLRFSPSSFVAICQEYNACVGGRQVVSEVAASRQRSYFALEAVAGAQSSNLRFEGAAPMKGVSISGGTQPVIGLALQQHLPMLNDRFGVRLELLYQRQQYNQEVFVPTTSPVQAYQEVRVNFDQVRIPLLLRYKPLSGHFQPFVEVGASVAFAVTNSNEYRYRGSPAAPYSSWRPILENPRGIEEGVLAGVGASVLLPNKRHLALELRAERTNAFSDDVGVGSTINRGYLLLSYDLSKPRLSN